MKTLLATRYVEIPEGVELEAKSRVVTVKGPRGELVQSFKHLNLDIQKAGKNKLRVELWFGNRKQVSEREAPVDPTTCTSAAGMYACLFCGACWSAQSPLGLRCFCVCLTWIVRDLAFFLLFIYTEDVCGERRLRCW